jgi:hypothetical protein
MNPSSVADLMRSLVKRYHIPTRPVLAPTEQPQQPITQSEHRSAAPTQQRMEALLQQLGEAQRENETLRESLKGKEAELESRSKRWSESE